MRHTLIELMHMAAGAVGTVLLASLAAWSVPLASRTIWQVAWVAIVVVIFMGIRPLRAAWRADRPIDPPHDKV